HVHQHTAAAPHFHLHSHAADPNHGHAHATVDARRSLGFGVAHGLAGSGAIAALLVAAVPDTVSRLFYFAAFSAGTIAGMLVVSLTLSVLVRFAADRGARWATILHVGAAAGSVVAGVVLDRKSTRLNSSHVSISYAVFCLKKKNKPPENANTTQITCY